MEPPVNAGLQEWIATQLINVDSNAYYAYLLMFLCMLPPGIAAGGNDRSDKSHIQHAAIGHIVYDNNVETICTESRTEPVGAGLFQTPPKTEISSQMDAPTMVKGKSIIPRRDFKQRRHNISERLKEFAETQCEYVNLEIASGSLEHPRNKRTVATLLGLSVFASAASALGWEAYQQVEIARHAGQLKAKGVLNNDEEDTVVLLGDSIRVVARNRQMMALERYLEDIYNQWVSAISELTSLRLNYDNIKSKILKEAIIKYQESIFTQHRGKYSRVISSRTTVTTLGCTRDNGIRFRICLHYASKANNADLIHVEDYGRFWSNHSQFAHIDIHHHGVRDGDAWFTVNLFQCIPDEYALREADGKTVTYKVPEEGVFFLQVNKNQTVTIGKELITGQNAVHFQANATKPTLVSVDEQMLAEELASLQQRAVRLTLKIDADGSAYATSAREN